MTLQDDARKLQKQIGKIRPRSAFGASLLLVSMIVLACISALPQTPDQNTYLQIDDTSSTTAILAQIPEFDGTPYVELCGGEPTFTPEEATTNTFERYAPLDILGRCGPAYCCLGPETLSTDPRGSISSIHPTGWHSSPYDEVEGGYLYNRCHLVAHQLAGEDANPNNLITGTRYFNVEGMLPFEEMVADYIRTTGNHVLYRVTPLFAGNELVARGVQMEALSMEDGGMGMEFHVFVYNCQPGISIDYATGDNQRQQQAC